MIATVVGHYPKIPNWPRSAKLRQAIQAHVRGEISREELARVEDEVTMEVIQEQVEAGLDLITDGQVRWEDGQTPFAQRIEGFRIGGLLRYFDTNMYYRQPIAEGPLRWTGPITVRDFEFAVRHSPVPVKPVLTGPYTLARLSANEHYPNLEAFVMALAEILNQEARALQDAGAQLIQFDEPAILKAREDFPLFARAMAVVTDGLRVSKALYTYFGDIAGLYPQILDLPFDVIGLDFVVGHRNWDVISRKGDRKGRPYAPFTKALGLGIVDARNTKMETVDKMVSAIERACAIVSPDRLYVNPTCGLEFLPRERAQEKLATMVRAVRKAEEVLS